MNVSSEAELATFRNYWSIAQTNCNEVVLNGSVKRSSTLHIIHDITTDSGNYIICQKVSTLALQWAITFTNSVTHTTLHDVWVRLQRFNNTNIKPTLGYNLEWMNSAPTLTTIYLKIVLTSIIYKVLDFHGTYWPSAGLLVGFCATEWLGFLTFQRNILPTSSGWVNPV
jgi:hypothetical protein